MAIGARIWSSELHRQVRARNTDAVITARIDHHVRACWHVTCDALRASRSGLVEMMARRIVLLRGMALLTNTVALGPKFEAVRLVTIATRDASMEHPALDERPIFVVFLLDLPIREIVVLVEQRHPVIVADRLTVHVIFMNLAASRVAPRAHLNFPLRATRRASARVAGQEIDRPFDAVAIVKRDRQAFVGKGLPITLLLGPRDVIGAGTVASLACDIDLRVGGGKSAGASIVVLAQIGRMTISTHVVPVLIDAGPMPRVLISDLLARV